MWLGLALASLSAARRDDLQPVRQRPIDLTRYNLKPIYENDLSQPQTVAREEDLIERLPSGAYRRKALPATNAEWIAEGWGGCVVRAGKLWVAPSEFDASGEPKAVEYSQRSHMVIWNQRMFPANFLLAFDMSPCGSTNGLTIVLFSATGNGGQDLFDLSLPPRRGVYAAYHSGAIANYTDAYWSRNNEVERTSNRFRKNPGFNEVAAGHSLTAESSDQTYHVRILKFGGHIEVEIDGNVVLAWEDSDKPHGAGRIGLRSMAGVTKIVYDNFRVWELTSRPNERAK